MRRAGAPTVRLLPDGSPMSQQWFYNQLAAVLRRCSLSPKRYTAPGRWSSDAYASYIRLAPHHVIEAQHAISGP